MAINLRLLWFLWHRFYVWLCVNCVEVTVNTCTCTDVFTVNTCTCIDVFTIITTNDQSVHGILYSSYSTGDQGFKTVVNKPCPWAIYTLGLSLFTAINPWCHAITITKPKLLSKSN